MRQAGSHTADKAALGPVNKIAKQVLAAEQYQEQRDEQEGMAVRQPGRDHGQPAGAAGLCIYVDDKNQQGQEQDIQYADDDIEYRQ